MKANIPSSKDPPVLIRCNGKRLDGATLVPWVRGKYVAWDATTIHTCAVSYIHLTSTMPGGVAEHAPDRKRAKYSSLPATHEFVPVAVESLGGLGPVNRASREFLMELGRRMTAVSCDPLHGDRAPVPALMHIQSEIQCRSLQRHFRTMHRGRGPLTRSRLMAHPRIVSKSLRNYSYLGQIKNNNLAAKQFCCVT